MTFEDILALPGTRLVLFYGTACAPCDILKPILRQAMKVQRLELVELNVAGEMSAARTLRLRSVPSVVLVADGRPRVISTGPNAPAEILERLRGLRS